DRPPLSRPFLRTVLPRKLSISAPARLSIEEPVDGWTPATLLKVLAAEDVLPPESIDRKRLPRLIAGEFEAPEPTRLATLPSTLPSAAGSLTRSNTRLMKERSSALLAKAPRTVGKAAPNPFVTAASDSPQAELALVSNSGVKSALSLSIMSPTGCIFADPSIWTSFA